MKNIFRFALSITLVFTFIFGSLPNVQACGPFTLSPFFSLKKHADFPLLEFTGGKTGIVPDTFGRMSLFVFYRRLNGLPLTKAEQKDVVRAMEDQIFYRSGVGQVTYENGTPKLPDYVNNWLTARTEVTGEKREIETEKRIADGYNYFHNCLPDAFNNAAKTLKARVAAHGKTDDVKEWLKGQDAVFSNCEESKGAPEPLGETAPEWLRRDRAYQTAAAQFYMGDFAAARETFEKIAGDDGSIWKPTARFVAARTLIRQASFTGNADDSEANPEAKAEKAEFLRKASEKLEQILKDNSMGEFHQSAFRLLGLVKYRLIPEQRQKELDGRLSQPSENKNIYNDLVDYRWLVDVTADNAESAGTDREAAEAAEANKEYLYSYRLKLRDIPPSRLTGDLTNWIFTYQAVDGFTHAYEKWKETGKLAWLVAAVTKAPADAGQAPELLKEADKIKPDSPAFATVRYHQVRLLTDGGKRAEARQKLDQLFAGNQNSLPKSAQNKFLAQRMTLAGNISEFLKYAPRKPVIFDWDETDREEGTSLKDDEYLSKWENRSMFDSDAVAFLNEKVPLSVLREAALSPELPDHLKKFIVEAVWTRAYILKNQAVERDFTPLMSRFATEFATLFAKYAYAKIPADREAAALIFVLRYPVIQPYVPTGYGREDSDPTSIDSIRGNWWCAEDQENEGYSSYDDYDFQYPASYPDFLTEPQVRTAANERRQMVSLGNSSTVLSRRAVEFAVKNPQHRQTPEILHLAVRSTRYGCKDDNTGKFSKQAFDILHKRYRASTWTKQTPYWFGQ